jgi:hypothetical protein
MAQWGLADLYEELSDLEFDFSSVLELVHGVGNGMADHGEVRSNSAGRYGAVSGACNQGKPRTWVM